MKTNQINLDEMHILLGHKSGKNNISLHLDNVSKYKLKSKSFETQAKLENDLINGTYDVNICVDFLIDIIDKKEPYVRVLKFFTLLLIADKIKNTKFFSTNKLDDNKLTDIKHGFVQMYGYYELLTLNNFHNIIDNLDKWQKELENKDIIDVCQLWKLDKGYELKLTPELLELYALIY